jgi:predicted regulator of Ras-like GTPase activity (Roadblock/LC7/MglB family)
MRSSDLPGLVASLRGPVNEFVRDARVRISLVISGSGQVLGQHGFTSGYEVMNVASLAAAAHASARALAELTQAGHWSHLHHAGRQQQLFLAPLETPVEKLILLAIFDAESSLGLVQFFFNRLATRVAALPALASARASADARTFERDLEAGLDRIFAHGRGEA